MKNISKNGKRILAVVAAAVVGTGAVFGIGTAVRKTTSSSVLVIPVSSVNYSIWMGSENSVSGMITSEAEQAVYVSDTVKVQEVLVKEGQAVHKGDPLLRYDTKSTRLSLEKEQINRERIELGIEVARENIKTLERISPISDGDGGFSRPGDFGMMAAYEEAIEKAEVYKKMLKADAKPVNNDPEDLTLGTEDNPYVFLCEGDSVTVTSDFIKKWQRVAKKSKLDKLYVALQTRDKTKALVRAWVADIMSMDPEFSLEVDLTTGQVGFAAGNDQVKIAKLLHKLLADIPEDERAAWLGVMLDKLMIFSEREEGSGKRGRLLAETIGELGKEDQKELAAAAALLDEETLSVLFKNLTPEQISGVEEEAAASVLSMLLENMTEEQIRALDGDVLAGFLSKLSAEQLTSLSTETLCQVLGALDGEQLQAVIEGLSDEKRQEIREILKRYEEEHGQGQGSGEGGEGQGQGGSGDNGGGDNGGGSGSGDNGGGSGSGDNGGGSGSGDNGGGSGSGDNGGGSGNNEGGSGDGGSGNNEGGSGEGGSGNNEGGSDDSGSGNNEGGSGDGGSGNNEGGSGEGGSGNNEGGSDGGSGNNEGGSDDGGNGGGSDDAGQGTSNSRNGSAAAADAAGAPSTAQAPLGTGGSSGGSLIDSDATYTSEELAQAKRDEKKKLLGLELDLKESEIKIKQAQRAIDSGVVTANMNGVVTSVSEADAPPSDGSAFLTLSGSEGLYVRSGIKESLFGQLSEGDFVTVTSWQNGNQYDAQIKSISPYPDSTGMFGDGSQTYYPFTANILDDNANFESGEWVEVAYTASVKKDDGAKTITLPKMFVREEDNRKYVYIRGTDGKLSKQYIVTGTLSDAGYEVLSGISESDWIAFPYGKNVKEGAKTREGSISDFYGG